MTLRLAIIFVTAASVLLFKTLINKIDKIVIQCKWTTRVYFWHFLSDVNCRISRALGDFAPSTPPHQGSALIFWETQNTSPQIHSCREVIACCGCEEHDVDVILLTETKVYTKSAMDIKGFQSFSAVRDKKSGDGLYLGIRHGLYESVMIDSGSKASFVTVCLNGKDFSVRLILVYGSLAYASM